MAISIDLLSRYLDVSDAETPRIGYETAQCFLLNSRDHYYSSFQVQTLRLLNLHNLHSLHSHHHSRTFGLCKAVRTNQAKSVSGLNTAGISSVL